MKCNKISLLIVGLVAFGFSACGNDDSFREPEPTDSRMVMNFNFSHPSQSRATETSFEVGDRVGLYVTDSKTEFEIAGNVVNNEKATFGASGWSFSRDLYWTKGEYNAYGYYPYQDDIPSITDLPFEVRTDQATSEADGALSGYEASDFLYGSSKGIQASADPVNLLFRHVMSKISVRMIKGEDFEGELPDDATVYINNTVTEATVDLQVGIATKLQRGKSNTITACPAGNHTYSAIIVPQRLDNRVPLIEVVMKGVSYMFESKFIFKQGTHHLVNLVIDKNPDQIKIEVGGEIENWN